MIMGISDYITLVIQYKNFLMEFWMWKNLIQKGIFSPNKQNKNEVKGPLLLMNRITQ